MAEQKLAWIQEQIAAGRTVYLSTVLRVITIGAKHLPYVRARGNALEVLQGRQGWVNCNGCRLEAR